jgi:WD40 repeat protein
MVPEGGPTQDIEKEEVSLVGHHKKVIQVLKSEMFCTPRTARVTAFAFEEAITGEAALTPRRGHIATARQVRWNPIAANVLATVSYDNTIKIWDIEQNGAEKHSFDDHNDAIQSFDWSEILLLLLICVGSSCCCCCCC